MIFQFHKKNLICKKNKIMNILKKFLIFFLFFSVFINSCKKEAENTEPQKETNKTPDTEGNLVIVNQINSDLTLYRGGKILKVIPANTNEFLVNIENDGNAVSLEIKKNDALFRRWDVVLSLGIAENERATWVIKDGTTGTDAGTISFSYPTETNSGLSSVYSVDVFLNNKNGAKITSLSPGIQNKKIGIGYALHTIYYRYWYSDPNGTAGSKEIGWIETNADGNNIRVLINTEHNNQNVEIPVFGPCNVGRWAKIKIRNNYNDYLQIYANGKLIGELLEINTNASSVIQPDGQYYDFYIPQGSYTLEAKNPTSNEIIFSWENFYLSELYESKWRLDQSLTYKTIEITNNTNKDLSFHNKENNEYLSFLLTSGESGTLKFLENINSLNAVSLDNLSNAFTNDVTSQWIINELSENPIFNFDFEMVYVAGGTFQMGSNDSEADGDETPVHTVTLNDFYIGKYEVTQKEWRDIMGNNPSYFTGDNLPVENVSWNDIQEFLIKLNEETGQNFRLPTEAEWEYAARGGNESENYKYSGSNNIDEVAWYYNNSNLQTHNVGTKTPNELGIYDMSGNVWEWCSDWYDSNYYSNSPTENPAGTTSGSIRVLRGGSWYDHAKYCRPANRFYITPDSGGSSVGFRLVLIP